MAIVNRLAFLAFTPQGCPGEAGHSSIQITFDTYSHVAPGLQEAAPALKRVYYPGIRAELQKRWFKTSISYLLAKC
jgi:hypothetical protein